MSEERKGRPGPLRHTLWTPCSFPVSHGAAHFNHSDRSSSMSGLRRCVAEGLIADRSGLISMINEKLQVHQFANVSTRYQCTILPLIGNFCSLNACCNIAFKVVVYSMYFLIDKIFLCYVQQGFNLKLELQSFPLLIYQLCCQLTIQ